MIDSWSISCELALRWMSLDFTDDKSTLVQVMAWCRQATSHYLSQCWPRYLSQYDVTRSLQSFHGNMFFVYNNYSLSTRIHPYNMVAIIIPFFPSASISLASEIVYSYIVIQSYDKIYSYISDAHLHSVYLSLATCVERIKETTSPWQCNEIEGLRGHRLDWSNTDPAKSEAKQQIALFLWKLMIHNFSL